MEGENGILNQPDVEELLRQFELFEIFTDTKSFANAPLQKKLTGYNANPTYIVLDSVTHLEVARFAYTNSKADFVKFLKKGLEDRPAFISQVRFSGTTIQEGGQDIVVLKPKGVLKVDAGTDETYDGQKIRVYRGKFSGSQKFIVGKDLDGDGKYPLTVHLVTGLYDGDERIETLSVSHKVYFEVLD